MGRLKVFGVISGVAVIDGIFFSYSDYSAEGITYPKIF